MQAGLIAQDQRREAARTKLNGYIRKCVYMKKMCTYMCVYGYICIVHLKERIYSTNVCVCCCIHALSKVRIYLTDVYMCVWLYIYNT